MGAVPALIGREVAEPEVGGEIHNGDPPRAQLGDQVRRGAVGQRDDRGHDSIERAEVRLAQLQRHAAPGVDLVEPLARVGP